MKKHYSSLFVKSAVALALAAPMLASAESSIVTGNATTAGATADLQFRVSIPGFIALKIGSGALLTNGGSTDVVEFALSDAQAIADGPIAGNAAVSVALLSNVGNVSFSSSGLALDDGAGNAIPLSAISVGTTTGNLAHPTFNAAAATVLATSGAKVINRSGTWAFNYNHLGATAPVGAGTYQTTVVYTAAAQP